MARLLVTGISGMLGSTLARIAHELDDEVEVIGAYNVHPVSFEHVRTVGLDLLDAGVMAAVLDEHEPDGVIHLAAMTNTSACERDENACEAVNVDATRDLAEACAEREIALVFTSTDLVFAGDDAPYSEDDEPEPVNTYGRSKAEGEGIVLGHERACVCRLPLLFGRAGPGYPEFGGSFLQGFLETLREGEPMTLFTDEYRSMASARDASLGLLMAAEQLLEGWSADGDRKILHLGGPERLSRFDFGSLLCAAFGIDPTLIKAGTQAETKLAAPRPADVSLNSDRAVALGYEPREAAVALASIAQGGD